VKNEPPDCHPELVERRCKGWFSV